MGGLGGMETLPEADPLDVLVPFLAEKELPAPADVKAALAAEVRRLCDQGVWGVGQSEIERLYALFPGPNTRRRALQKLLKRVAKGFPKEFVEVWVMCFEDTVCLEVAVAPTRDGLEGAPVAQARIFLSLFRDKPPRVETV